MKKRMKLALFIAVRRTIWIIIVMVLGGEFYLCAKELLCFLINNLK